MKVVAFLGLSVLALGASSCPTLPPVNPCALYPQLCIPIPSPSPSNAPIPSPGPMASPSPVSTPPPIPIPSPIPSSTPTALPTPTPVPSVVPCVAVELPNIPIRPGNPPCRGDFEEGAGRCWVKSAGGVDCRPCAQLNALDLRGGHIVIEDGWAADPPRGYRDAYCRRTLDKETFPHGDYGSWVYWGVCAPLQGAPCPTPSASPVGGEDPTPGQICNGEWEAPSSFCASVVVTRMGCGVLNVARNSQSTSRKGTEDNPIWVGDKVTMNSSPKYAIPVCTRGAVVPGNCIVPRFADITNWKITPDIGIQVEEGGASNGYLAQWKATQSGVFTTTVCIKSVCQNSPPLYVVDGQ